MSEVELTVEVVKSYLASKNNEMISPESLQQLIKTTHETILSLPPSN